MRTLPVIAIALALFTAACNHQAAHTPAAIEAKPRLQEYPWMSLERWYRMHAEDVGIAARDEVDVLFIGDSITEGWPEPLMEQLFGRYQPANFGIGGDQTDNLLWRLRHGSVGQLQPRLVSLLIGVNNFGLRQDSPEDVILGVTAVVEELLQAFPSASIIVHGIFPYKESADSPERTQVATVNAQLAQLAAHERVVYLDIGPQLLMANGDLSPEIMPDFLHLSEQGYRIWGAALLPLVQQLMAE